MDIKMEDIYYGFIKRYETFQLNYDQAGATHYTREILRHFEQLGLMVGYNTRFEKKFTIKSKERIYDLIWYEVEIEKPYLHVEHENSPSWEKLEDTAFKVNESVCDNVIAIMYPRNRILWQKLLNLLREKQKSWGGRYDILIIIDPYEIEHDYKIEGHIFRPEKNSVIEGTIRKNEDTGNLYAFY